ncbi:MAG: hypothetical protein AAFN76_13505, partial [Pseudomonadota bacterium]
APANSNTIGSPIALATRASDETVMFYCSYALDALGFTLDVSYTDYAVVNQMILNHVCDITGLGGCSELPPGANECFLRHSERARVPVYVSAGFKVRSRTLPSRRCLIAT